MTASNVRITRRATFAAAHVLCRPEWSDEKNRAAFGEDVHEHGHSYVIEVTVGGAVDRDTGMVVNLSHIDDVLRRQFISAVDHRNLNRDVDFMQGVLPTAENIALAAFHRLETAFKPARLLKVRVAESENNSAEVSAD
jgi:6-pyruvoyltetrahydropterin/6-carboxytetrahydropterin synthase